MRPARGDSQFFREGNLEMLEGLKKVLEDPSAEILNWAGNAWQAGILFVLYPKFWEKSRKDDPQERA